MFDQLAIRTSEGSDLRAVGKSDPDGAVAPQSMTFNFAQSKRAASTRKGYEDDFRLFQRWCEGHGLPALPADAAAVATYLAVEAQRGIRPATLNRRVAAIRYAHTEMGHPSPTADQRVRDVVDQPVPSTADDLTTVHKGVRDVSCGGGEHHRENGSHHEGGDGCEQAAKHSQAAERGSVTGELFHHGVLIGPPTSALRRGP